MMKIVLCLLFIGVATVLADNYLCPTRDGEPFECFESDVTYRSCLTNGRRGDAYVVCSKCKRNWEFCVTRGTFSESKHPESDCGADYKTTPCTTENSEWAKTFNLRV